MQRSRQPHLTTSTSQSLLARIQIYIPDLGDLVVPPMDRIIVTPDGILRLLQEINIRKTTVPDMIPARILKDYAELAPILTFIFQQSLDSGSVPSDWHTAHIVLIYKKGNTVRVFHLTIALSQL